MTFSFSQLRLRFGSYLLAASFAMTPSRPICSSRFQNLVPVDREVLGNLNAVARRHDLGQGSLTIEERGVPKIVAIPIEQIEDEQLHRRFPGKMRDLVRIRLVDAGLEQTESRAALLIEYGNLRVKDRCARRQGGAE